MATIKYLSSGKLGDVIHLLSIINEKYLESGKKGILYITDSPEQFQHGVTMAYEDTKNYITSLPYIEGYFIHLGEHVDINLIDWRNSHLLYKTNWYEIFKQTYNVTWAANQWFFSNKNPELENKVLIGCGRTKRFPYNINFQNLLTRFKDYDVVFISHHKDDYNFFKEQTNVTCNFYQAKSIEDLIRGINSCYCFIGSLSSPLAIAHALHIKNIMVLSNKQILDNAHVKDLELFLKDTEIVIN